MKAVSLSLLASLAFSQAANDVCTLSGSSKALKAYPSLVKCYRNNNAACCVSAHDQYIQDAMSSLLTSACEREYTELEHYFCYGCHYTEPEITDNTNKVIKMCESYVERLWGGAVDKPTSKFDECGMTVNGKVIVPSQIYSGALEFF